MNNQQKLIKQIEVKIKETQSTLTLWTNNIATYQKQLAELINQLNEIKLQIKKK